MASKIKQTQNENQNGSGRDKKSGERSASTASNAAAAASSTTCANTDVVPPVSKVHSSNSWENAELGDDDRKKKFLKLMGASKSKHEGRFVIGDHKADHFRTKEDNDKMTRNIEGIYKQGLEHKLTGAARRHRGLGFLPGDMTPIPVDSNVDKSVESPSDTHISTHDKPKLIGFCKAGTLADEREALKKKRDVKCDEVSNDGPGGDEVSNDGPGGDEVSNDGPGGDEVDQESSLNKREKRLADSCNDESVVKSLKTSKS